MSFREKSAWISFVSILLVFGIYFAQVAKTLITQSGGGNEFHLFVLLTIGLVIVEVVLHVAAAIHSPREARTPKDERERLIELKATSIAFPVLISGALAAILTMHFGLGRWEMAHTVLLAVVVSELVRFGAQIVYHRRGL